MASDLDGFGLKQEARHFAARPAPKFEIFPENELIVDVFVNLDTQWRRVGVGMASLITEGIDYRALESTVRLMGIEQPLWPEILAGIRQMENAALKVIRERENRG